MDEQLFSEFPKEFTETFLADCEGPAPAQTFVAGLERQLLERQQAFHDHAQQPSSRGTRKSFGAVHDVRLAFPAWLSGRRWQVAGLVLLVCLGAALLAIGPQRVMAQIQSWLGYLPGAGFVNPDQTRILAAPFEARQGNSTLVVQQVIAGPDKTIMVVKLTSTAEEIFVRMQSWSGQVTLILPDGQRLTSRQSSETVSAGKLSAEFEYPALPVGILQVTLEMPKLPIDANGMQEFWSVSLPLQAARAAAPYTPKNGQVSNQGVTVRVLQVGQSAQDTGVLVEIDWNDPTWDFIGAGAELRDNLGKVYQRMDPYPGSPDVYTGVPRGMTTVQEMLRFSALDSNARQVTLSLSGITFEIHPQAQFTFDPGKTTYLDQTWSFAGDPTKRLEIAGFPVQVLQADLAYAPASDQVTVVNPSSATALPQPTPLPAFACRLEFVLQVTQQAHARIFPGGVSLGSLELGPSGVTGEGDHNYRIYLDLMELPSTPLTIHLNDAHLMLEGGWQISWELARGTP